MIKRRVVFSMWLVLGAGLSPALAADTPAPMAAAPRTADEWAAVASQRLKDGERDAAIEALQAAVAADPTNGAAGLLITTLYQAGRIEEAYALGERYHREGPRNPRALFRYGWLLAFIGEVDRAVAARPADMISRVGRAQMMVEAGDARAAVPLLEAELAANPAARGYGAVPASLVLGWALRLSGDEAAAARWLDPLEAELLAAQANATVRQLGMEPMNAARQLAYLAVRGRRDGIDAERKRLGLAPLRRVR